MMVDRVYVRAAIAPLHGEPRVSSPQISQRLAGQMLDVLESRDEWARVRGEDRYEGWMHRGYLRTDDPSPNGRLSLGCGLKGGRLLPLGARLAREDVVVAGEAIAPAERVRRFPVDPAATARTAVELFVGTPYQWGGITPWGADCSGLVQTVWWLHGVNVPRDAYQQAELGEPGSMRLEELTAGDLLFFSDRTDGRITHVGIATGPRGMVHLGLGRGGYAVERLDDAEDPYVAVLRTRLRFVRRMPPGLSSSDTPTISHIGNPHDDER
jgi:gamma-D-glutamyl-L-lysine dipeptidyl-peptidase